jgi:hypothetical protein
MLERVMKAMLPVLHKYDDVCPVKGDIKVLPDNQGELIVYVLSPTGKPLGILDLTERDESDEEEEDDDDDDSGYDSEPCYATNSKDDNGRPRSNSIE